MILVELSCEEEGDKNSKQKENTGAFVQGYFGLLPTLLHLDMDPASGCCRSGYVSDPTAAQ